MLFRSDIDMANAKENQVQDFKRGVNGYKGHHPSLYQGKQRHYEVDISIPGLKVCQGIIFFGLLRKIALEATLGFQGSLTFKHIPGGSKRS